MAFVTVTSYSVLWESGPIRPRPRDDAPEQIITLDSLGRIDIERLIDEQGDGLLTIDAAIMLFESLGLAIQQANKLRHKKTSRGSAPGKITSRETTHFDEDTIPHGRCDSPARCDCTCGGCMRAWRVADKPGPPKIPGDPKGRRKP